MNTRKSPFWPVGRFLSHQKPACVVSLGLCLVVCLGTLDAVTGSEFSFTIFYLAPVFLVAWYTNFRWAISISLSCSTAMLMADHLSQVHYPHPLIVVWNESARFGFMLIFAYLIVDIRSRYEREKHLSRMDPLTEIPNRRAFFEAVSDEIQRARRHHRPTTIAYLDIDNFKPINDRLGHHVGDQVLRAVAHIMRAELRQTDMVARLGGDEYAVLLPETNAEAFLAVASKFQHALIGYATEKNWNISFSVGAITFLDSSKSAEDVIHEADQLMYRCKQARDGVMRHRVFVGCCEFKVTDAVG